MKRIFLYLLLSILLLCGGILTYCYISNERAYAIQHADTDEIIVGRYPLGVKRIRHNQEQTLDPTHGYPTKHAINLMGNQEFILDTSSSLNIITPHTLDVLKGTGIHVDSALCLMIGHDYCGNLRIAGCRYTIDLPLATYNTESNDSNQIIRWVPAERTPITIKNITFIKGNEYDENTFGIPFLEKFSLEFIAMGYGISFLSSVPHDQYRPLCKLYKKPLLRSIIEPGDRYYTDLTINHDRGSFFIDTGLGRLKLKMPYKNAAYVNSNLRPVLFPTTRGTVNAFVDDFASIEIGDRICQHYMGFMDDHEEPYAVNPFNLLSQDIIIDFPGEQLCIHPHVKKLINSKN